MGLKFGLNMKMFDADGTPDVTDGKFDVPGTSGSWSAVANHMGYSLNFDATMDDVTTAGSEFEMEAIVLNKVNATFKVPYDPDNDFCAKLLTAFFDKTPLPLIFADGLLDATKLFGVGGYWAIKLSLPADLKTAVKIDVTASPTYDSVVMPHKILKGFS